MQRMWSFESILNWKCAFSNISNFLNPALSKPPIMIVVSVQFNPDKTYLLHKGKSQCTTGLQFAGFYSFKQDNMQFV